MDKKEIEFHKVLGLIIANELSKEYNGYNALLFKESGNNYLSNICTKAEQAEEKVLKQLKISNKEVKEMLLKYKDLYSNFIFDYLALPAEKQERVYKLVEKLKKEENV